MTDNEGDATAGAPAVAATSEEVSTITPRFKLIFITVTAFTVGFFLASLLMTLLIVDPTPEARNLMDTFTRLATAGFGAIIGLLGGKAV